MGETDNEKRLRIDRLIVGSAHRRQVARTTPQGAAAGEALGADAPVFAVVILSLDGDAMTYADACTLGAAKRLQMCHAPEQAVAVLVLGPGPVDPEIYQARGADLVIKARVPAVDPLFGCRTEIALSEIAQLAPAHVFFVHQTGAARSLTLGVAAGLRAPAALLVRHLDVPTITTQSETTQSGKVLELTAPQLIELREGSSEPWVGPCRKARVRLSLAADRIQPLGTQVEDLGQVSGGEAALRLDEAEFIVSGGAGISDWVLFRETVSALGAAAGASRVAVDAGLAPRETQVGSSGAIVRAKCYLALGISGAPQHLEGIAACDQVIAVNTDANCAMMRRADLAIEADAQAVMRAILTQLAKRREGKDVA